MKSILIFSICVLSATFITTKKLDKYELAIELYNNGFKNIDEWMCIVDINSGFETGLQWDRAPRRRHGIFQFYEGVWCAVGEKGYGCNIECEKFLDDDLTDDFACAKIVYEQQGFTAWRGLGSICFPNTTYLHNDCA